MGVRQVSSRLICFAHVSKYTKSGEQGQRPVPGCRGQAGVVGESDKRLKLLRLISATPVLAAHQQSGKAPVWSRVLGSELARRLGADEADESDPRPAALVTAALGCLDAALLAWAASEGRRELTVVLNQSLDAVGA